MVARRWNVVLCFIGFFRLKMLWVHICALGCDKLLVTTFLNNVWFEALSDVWARCELPLPIRNSVLMHVLSFMWWAHVLRIFLVHVEGDWNGRLVDNHAWLGVLLVYLGLLGRLVWIVHNCQVALIIDLFFAPYVASFAVLVKFTAYHALWYFFLMYDIPTVFLILFDRSHRVELEIRLHDQSHWTYLIVCALLSTRLDVMIRRRQQRILLLICLIDRAVMSIDTCAITVWLCLI